MERRSEKRKWLARERQHQLRQRIKVNAEAIEQVKEEDCTEYGNEWLSNQVHVEEQNCEQFQRCHANIQLAGLQSRNFLTLIWEKISFTMH